MPFDDTAYVDLFKNRKRFSRKQIEIFEWYRAQRALKQAGLPFEHILSMLWGRRCGKSDGSSALFSEIVVDLLCDDADRIARGELRPWAGIGQTRTKARRAKPHSLAFVVAPEGRDLVDIQGHMLEVFRDEADVFLHDDPKLQIFDSGSKMLFYHEGAALQLWFIPAKQAPAMVGRGPKAVLLTESGFIPSMHWDRLIPALWDHAAWVIAEGTPKQDHSHWLTQLAVSGLEDGHPEADRRIAKRNPRVHTSRANTIEHAFLPGARERAREELRYRGERWAKLWIYASWELPADVVFDEYRPDRAVVQFDPSPVPTIIFPNGETKVLPKPDTIELDKDWHQGGRPGAATVTYIWNRVNPLDRDDPRPLMIVAGEFMDDEVDGEKKRLPYTTGSGWWGVLRDLWVRYGVRRGYADPSGKEMFVGARKAGLRLIPAEAQDKSGRIQLLNAQCHVPVYGEGDDRREGYPALLISRACPKTAHCIGTLQWRKDAEGNPSDTPSGYNDHLADCLCYAAGRWARPGARIPAMW